MISTGLSRVLAARRAYFNQRAMEMRHRMPSLDLTAFKAFLNQQVDAVALAVETADPDATGDAVDAAYAIGLELVSKALAGPGAHAPWVDRAWQQLAPVLGNLLAKDATQTLGTISNAVIRLGGVAGARVPDWLDAMRRLAGQCQDVVELRRLGAVCAWRAGMAHLRGPALDQGSLLDPALACAAVAAPSNFTWPSLKASLLEDPWWSPREEPVRGWMVGSFTGFGGPFPAPPQVRGTRDGFVVASGSHHFLLVADAFGAVVLPAGEEEFSAGQTASVDAKLVGRLPASPLPPADLKTVRNERSVALYSPWSHRIHVLPLPA